MPRGPVNNERSGQMILEKRQRSPETTAIGRIFGREAGLIHWTSN
ncbi:hypothetical protein OB236_23485 [Paenibacillus sp. WQ 127069]|uniref:Uncharacterized protein n=1 Tax=Paenibacillus baimaensis TaxID=2982185 RepID=A0ABT2UKB0_9BACL|nr:hypothetical protein [Paenibacillus sp. WQ 127069]